jgi:hypothetical protein
VGPYETFIRPWIPLFVRAWSHQSANAAVPHTSTNTSDPHMHGNTPSPPPASTSAPRPSHQSADAAVPGDSHDQADAEWNVIRTQLRGHKDTPFGWPAPQAGPPGPPRGSGRPPGIFCMF